MSKRKRTKAELEALRNKLDEALQTEDYDELNSQIEKVAYQAVNTPTEFDSAMQVPDFEKILKAKRRRFTFLESLLNRALAMLSWRPIVGNLIALTLAIIAIIGLNTQLHHSQLEILRPYLIVGIELVLALQIIKSSSRSLLLPVLALIAAWVGIHHSNHHLIQHWFVLPYFFQALLVVAVIGVGAAILTID